MYETLSDLVAAVRSGEITGTLVIDNDETFVYEGDKEVFRMHPSQALEEALDMLSVPHESA